MTVVLLIVLVEVLLLVIHMEIAFLMPLELLLVRVRQDGLAAIVEFQSVKTIVLDMDIAMEVMRFLNVIVTWVGSIRIVLFQYVLEFQNALNMEPAIR